jgi:outer membrane protein assembly factor BamB
MPADTCHAFCSSPRTLRHLRRGLFAMALGTLAWSAIHAGDTASPTAKVRIVPTDGDGAKYWPRWRGPSGQGLVEGGNYPDRWSGTDNVLWKIEVPGKGNSSPIVWADKIFLTTAYDNGKRRSILCFARGSGKKLWETFAPAAKPEGAYGKNGWATSTPTTDGQRVYGYFGYAGLLCADMDGKEVWHKTIATTNTLHGMAGSPLLYKDRIVLYQELDAGGFIIALDKRDGATLWKTPRKETVGWGSPLAITVGSQDQIIVSSQYCVYAYDPADGKVIWTCGGNTLEVIPSPVVAHDLLFCCSGRAGPTLAIRPEGAAGDVTGTHVAWKANKGSPFVPGPLVCGDYLYMVNDLLSLVTCYEAKTGKLQWQERCGEPAREGFSAAAVGVNGKVFFTNDQGETFVLKAGPKFELLHVNRIGERTLASPALVDGRWYIRTERHLFCIGEKK